MKRLATFLTVLGLSLSLYSLRVFGQFPFIKGTEQNSTYPKEMLLGNILKMALEKMHLKHQVIDDSLSEKISAAFLEKIDYGKQFLLQSDVEQLKKYDREFDNELVSGKLEVADLATIMVHNRVKEIKAYASDILSRPFDLEKSEGIETDPKKRNYVKSVDELKDLWRRILKQEILNKLADLKEEQAEQLNPTAKKKDSKKDKKKISKDDLKKATLADLEKKAREETAKSFTKVFDRMLDPKNEASEKLDRFYNAITKVFDPHTQYLIPEEKEDFDIDISGKLEGIGALLEEENSFIKVKSIIPGSASWKTKELEAEDTILKVGQGPKEPVDIFGMSLRDAVKMIRGPKGTEVRLTVKKPNGIKKVVSIVRDVVEIEESYAKGVTIEHKSLNGKKYGYISVPKFYRDFQDRKGRNVTQDVKDALKALNQKSVDGLVLDLRNNGGGSLEDAKLVSGLFIPQGPIVQVKAYTGEVEILKDQDPSMDFTKPVVVLINAFSASASEIVAAALQDYNRAVIVGGPHSHGKGTVQAVLELERFLPPSQSAPQYQLGALKITIQKFYRVNGGSTQYRGVVPDIILPDPFESLDTGEQALEYSIPWSEVKAVDYKKTAGMIPDLKALRKNSEARVANNKKIQIMETRGKWFKERKNKTYVSLKLDEFLKESETVKKQNEESKNEELNTQLTVESLKKEKSDERFKEYKENLLKDPVLEESLFILSDLTSQTKSN